MPTQRLACLQRPQLHAVLPCDLHFAHTFIKVTLTLTLTQTLTLTPNPNPNQVILGCSVASIGWAVGSDALGLDAGLRHRP